MDEKIKNAILTHNAKLREMHDLPRILASEEPQTQEEADSWVQRAQAVRKKMLELEKQCLDLRTETVTYLNSAESLKCPVSEAVLDYFKAENSYFHVCKKSEGMTSVRIYKLNSPSEEDRQYFEAVGKLGELLLASYQRVLDAQSELLFQADQQGFALPPAWEPESQEQTLEVFRHMIKMSERIEDTG